MNNVTCQDQADTLLQLWESGNITGNKSDIAILDLLEQLAISHFRDFRISALSTKSSVTATSIVCRLVPDTENWLVSNTGEAAVPFFIEKKLRIFFTFSIWVFPNLWSERAVSPILDRSLVFCTPYIDTWCRPVSIWQTTLQIFDQSANFYQSESTFLLNFCPCWLKTIT